MKSSTKPFKSAAMRRTHLSVPFDEMRRLMRVYGSTKCLRKRQSSAGEGAKDESVKRKFYRWFPDLEERFVRDEAGFWRPRNGHQAEMNYREAMRRRDGEVTSRKRTRNRRLGLGGAKVQVPVATAVRSNEEVLGPVVTAVGSGAERAAAPFVMNASGGGDLGAERAGTLSVLGYKAASTLKGCDPVSPAPPPVEQPRFDQESMTAGGTAASVRRVSTCAEALSTPVHETASTFKGCNSVSSAPCRAKVPAATAVSSGVEREVPAPVASAVISSDEAVAAPSFASGSSIQDSKKAETPAVSGYEVASTSKGCDPVPPVAQPRFDQELTTTEGEYTAIIEEDEPKRAEASSTPACEAMPISTGFNLVSPAPPPILQPCSDREAPRFQDPHAISILVDAGPLDGSFQAQLGIFDDVERSFYGACPSLSSSSSCGSASSEDASPPADGTLDESMAEFCAEVLASGGEVGGASVFRFDKL